MNLRARVILAMLLLVFAVLASALATVYVSERKFLLRQVDLEARDSTRKLAKVCEEALAGQSDIIALNYIKAWKETPGASRVVLVRTDGTVYLHSDLLRGDSSAVRKPLADPFAASALAAPDILSETAVESARETLKLSAPVVVFGKRFGAVIAYYDFAELKGRVAGALNVMAGHMLYSSAGALALGFLLALWLATSLNRPIRELVSGARRIGSGDFSSAIAVRGADELGQLAQEFNLMAQKLSELDRMKERFLHSVSHEMRAPLSVVASAVYHARRVTEAGKGDGLIEDITQIERGVERLTGFVNNILDLALLEAHRMSFAFERVLPAALLAEVGGLYARKAEEYKIGFAVEEGKGLKAVRADPGRVAQVLANLVLNAFKFTPEGGQVSVGAEAAEEGVVFSVSDTGPGIPAAAQPGLFSRFGLSAPAPNPRKLASSGLGLSICKEIVDAHAGRIWAVSEDGRGSRFFFSLPYWSETAGTPEG